MACVCHRTVGGRWSVVVARASRARGRCVVCRVSRQAARGRRAARVLAHDMHMHMQHTQQHMHMQTQTRKVLSGRKVDSGRQIARPARSQQAHTALDRSYNLKDGEDRGTHTKTLTERYRSGWSRQRDLPPPPHNRFHGLRTPRTRAPPQATTPRRRPGEWEQRQSLRWCQSCC